jgi:hypothetical protein
MTQLIVFLFLLYNFNSFYIPLLLCHSICFILHKMFYTLILLYVIYFRYTTYSICISSNSDESKKLPDDGRSLPKHVGACILNKGVVKFNACVGCFFYSIFFKYRSIIQFFYKYKSNMTA